MKKSPYTRPELREKLKARILAGDKGGNPGEWSARKAQLLAIAYKKAGGGYRGGKKDSQESLEEWTDQEWQTKSGKPSLETGERYLPKKVIQRLSPQQYAATTRAKREAMEDGEQFAPQPKKIAQRTAKLRKRIG